MANGAILPKVSDLVSVVPSAPLIRIHQQRAVPGPRARTCPWRASTNSETDSPDGGGACVPRTSSDSNFGAEHFVNTGIWRRTFFACRV
jgi:hypothetical protein